MTVHSELIVLNTTKVGEKTLVVHTLSSVWGRRSFIAGVAKGSGMALYLPLNILDAEVVENNRSDLWRIKNVSSRYPLNGIRSSFGKNSMTMFLSEVLFRAIRDGVYEDGLFEWCCRSILTLDALENDFSNYHLRFLLELAGAMGFSPSISNLAPFAGERYSDLQKLLQSDFGNFMLYPLNGETRNEIAGILLRYLSCNTESAINVKSLAVLRELFA